MATSSDRPFCRLEKASWNFGGVGSIHPGGEENFQHFQRRNSWWRLGRDRSMAILEKLSAAHSLEIDSHVLSTNFPSSLHQRYKLRPTVYHKQLFKNTEVILNFWSTSNDNPISEFIPDPVDI